MAADAAKVESRAISAARKPQAWIFFMGPRSPSKKAHLGDEWTGGDGAVPLRFGRGDRRRSDGTDQPANSPKGRFRLVKLRKICGAKVAWDANPLDCRRIRPLLG